MLAALEIEEGSHRLRRKKASQVEKARKETL